MPKLRIASRLGRVMRTLTAARTCGTGPLAAGSLAPCPQPRRPRGRAAGLLSPVAVCAAAVSLAALAGLPSQPASAALAGPARAGRLGAAVPGLRPVIRTALRHDLSPPLRSMRPVRPPSSGRVRVIPNPNPLRARAGHAPRPPAPVRTAGVQRRAGTAAMPAFQQNFEGVDATSPGNPCQCLPPDTNGAVGPSDYVQTVNTALAVWSKQGQLLFGPVDLATLWQGFGGACDPAADPANADGGDPIVLYDEQANRWFISQLAFPGGSSGFHDCIAVSQTGDPAGAYNRYDFLFSKTTLNDYPKYGVWPDAYYQSVNDFANASSFTGVTVTAFDRAAMLAGRPARSVSFTLANANDAYLLPANWEGGALGQAPPAGAPNPYVMSCDANNGGPCTSDQIDEWDFHVDWSSPANSTFGNNGAPSATLPTGNFNGDLCGFSRNCIPQPGTGQGIDPGSDKLMYQAAYRDIGGTQTIVLSQTVNAAADPATGTQAGINWYELAKGGSGWSIADQGTYAPDAKDRFMPSANIDVSGDIAAGYSVSSSATFPSIAVAGRLARDPAGQLAQGEKTLIAGGGSQTNSHARWGDYSAMQVDPADGCTFWYTTEYYSATSDHNWQTRIGSFSYPSCSFTHGTLSGTVTDAATGQPVAGATVTADGVSVSTGAGGSYSFDLPPGTTQVTASDYGFQTQTQTVTITANQTTTQNFALTGTPHETVSGTVTPATGTAWPLYAQVTWTDGHGHGGTTFTSPATGKYALSLLADASYTLTAHAEYPGYTDPAPATVTVAASDVTQDFTAGVDLLACTAIGYHQVLSGTTQPFSQTSVPPGWQVTNTNLHIPYYQSQPGWQFTNPGRRPNHTGGTGNFAIVDSDHAGQFHYQDTGLTTPVASFAADKTPVVQFNTDLEPAVNSTAAVGLSADGGKTWASIWTSQGFPGQPGPATVVIPVPQASGKSSIRVRFGFTGQWSQWWEIDNVFLGNRTCAQQSGGLLTGRVADSAENAINGATVASVANASEKAVTMATPGDSAINGGLYDLFVTETGSQQYTASATGHTASTQSATITAGQATTLNFTLAP
jgi:Carboxypeptidase regulatory-like domain